MSLSKKLRFEIFKRDSFACKYCGRKPPDVVLEVDHILPINSGGQDEQENLLTSCFDCNRGKGKIELGTKTLDAIDTEKEQERHEQFKQYEKFLRSKQSYKNRKINKLCDFWSELCNEKYGLNFYGKRSLSRFAEKLPDSEIKEAMEIAAAKIPFNRIQDRFKYFCGICHSKIRGPNA